jgi:hypothetical protein
MAPNQNMMKFMGMMRSGGNPEQMVMNMLQNSASGNPVLQNLVSLAQQGNTREIESVVRNMAKEKGIDFDSEFNSFKQMFGL